MNKTLFLYLSLGAALPAGAQDIHEWYRPGSRVVAPGTLDRSISDTMGIPFAILLPARATEKSSFATAVGRVFAAMAAAYTELKIPTQIRDSAMLEVGNPGFYSRSDLGGRTLSIYLECGSDINGIWADIYRISMSLVTFITPIDADSVQVRSVLFARAVDIPKPQPTRECGTTGELERRIYSLMLKNLGKEGYRKP